MTGVLSQNFAWEMSRERAPIWELWILSRYGMKLRSPSGGINEIFWEITLFKMNDKVYLMRYLNLWTEDFTILSRSQLETINVTNSKKHKKYQFRRIFTNLMHISARLWCHYLLSVRKLWMQITRTVSLQTFELRMNGINCMAHIYAQAKINSLFMS